MTASVIAMPAARAYALARGARRLAVRSTLAFAASLAATGVVDVFGAPARALPWALACGAAAGALYASALVLVARSAELEDRVRGMATVHAAGSAGFALGALTAGVLVPVLSGGLVIALPGIAIITAAAIGVWITVPDATIGGPAIPPRARRTSDQPVT
jgi:MFS family permease